MSRLPILKHDAIDWGRPIRRPAYALTQASAAESFAAAYGSQVLKDHRRNRWLIYRGHRLVPDTNSAITRLALEHIRRKQHDALDIKDSFERTEAITHWMKFDRAAELTTMIETAGKLEPIASSGDMFDRDPRLLGVPNGVIELPTGTLRDGRADDYITRNTSVPYDPEALCPAWERFLADVLSGDADLIDFVHRAIGYSLTGFTDEQVLFLAYGGRQ